MSKVCKLSRRPKIIFKLSWSDWNQTKPQFFLTLMSTLLTSENFKSLPYWRLIRLAFMLTFTLYANEIRIHVGYMLTFSREGNTQKSKTCWHSTSEKPQNYNIFWHLSEMGSFSGCSVYRTENVVMMKQKIFHAQKHKNK